MGGRLTTVSKAPTVHRGMLQHFSIRLGGMAPERRSLQSDQRRQRIYAFAHNGQNKALRSDGGQLHLQHNSVDPRATATLGGSHNAYDGEQCRREEADQRDTTRDL